MRMPKHRERSSQILAHLAGWGFSADVQQRIGTLVVVWGVFETNLESALWALRGEKVVGTRPWTDATSVSRWIDELGQDWPQLAPAADGMLPMASLAAKDLMDYRHAIMHGSMIPSASMPTFIRNPQWSGEKRARPTHDAHVDQNLLDMAIDTAWSLCQTVIAVRAACVDPAKVAALATLKRNIVRAKSQANELRHLSAVVNHEKY
jgi:hypothetical protein